MAVSGQTAPVTEDQRWLFPPNLPLQTADRFESTDGDLLSGFSAHTSEPQRGPGKLFWQLSPAVSKTGIKVKIGTTKHADKSLTNVCVSEHESAPVSSPPMGFNDQWNAVRCKLMPLEEYFYISRSAVVSTTKSVRINPRRPLCRAGCGFLSQWLTMTVIGGEWAEVLTDVQKLRASEDLMGSKRTEGCPEFKCETFKKSLHGLCIRTQRKGRVYLFIILQFVVQDDSVRLVWLGPGKGDAVHTAAHLVHNRHRRRSCKETETKKTC